MVNSYIAIDIETTGLNPKCDKITEIGAVKVIDGLVADTYESFVNPRRKLEEKTIALTGITDEMLRDAPGIECIIPEVIDFCEDLPFLGHHIIFDFSFLKKAAVNHYLMLDKDGIDTLKLCRLFMPEGEKKNLSSACSFYQIENNHAHRALSDAQASHLLYQTLAFRYESDKPNAFALKTLNYKVKKEQTATKRQKDHLRDLLKYHRINLSLQIDFLSRNEISRITDKIISKYGRI